MATTTLALLSLAGCGGDGGPDVTFVDGDQCAGFTPAGDRLDDQEMLDAAAAEWQRSQDDDNPLPASPALEDGAELCVVYAGVSDFGLPRVAMVSEDTGRGDFFVALFTGMEDDDLDVAHIDDIRYLGDTGTAIGVGDGLWLLADRVQSAAVHTGTPTAAVETQALDLAETRLIDPGELLDPEGDQARVVIAETGQGPVLVAAAAREAGESDYIAEAPRADSPVDPMSVLHLPGGAPVLADAIRAARGDEQYRPAELQLLGTTAVPEVGAVLASATAPETGEVRPYVSIGTPTEVHGVPVGPVFARDGREAVESLDASLGWAAGILLVHSTSGPLAYVVAVSHRPMSTVRCSSTCGWARPVTNALARWRGRRPTADRRPPQ